MEEPCTDLVQKFYKPPQLMLPSRGLQSVQVEFTEVYHSVELIGTQVFFLRSQKIPQVYHPYQEIAVRKVIIPIYHLHRSLSKSNGYRVASHYPVAFYSRSGIQLRLMLARSLQVHGRYIELGLREYRQYVLLHQFFTSREHSKSFSLVS